MFAVDQAYIPQERHQRQNRQRERWRNIAGKLPTVAFVARGRRRRVVKSEPEMRLIHNRAAAGRRRM